MKRLLILFVFFVNSFLLFSQITIPVLIEAAKKGDLYAQKFLGDVYSKGTYGAERNLQEACKWYLAAAKQGDAEAQYELAVRLNYMKDNITQEEFNESMNWMIKSADNGFPVAQAIIGQFYKVAGKENLAFDYFYRAAKGNSPKGTLGLADCYLHGIGTIVNLTEAKRLYELSLNEYQSQDAYLGLADCALEEKDYTNAKNYLQKGIEAELPEAYCDMARLYAEGKGVRIDFKEAHRLIDTAIGMSPSNILFYERKGEFYLMEGKADKAQELWTKLLKLDSTLTERDSPFAQAMMNSVDNNIPESSLKSEKTFTLIIANEEYKRVPPVPFAKNDGNIFAEYCKKTLGVPGKNVYLVEDATLGDIKYHINQMKKIADAFNGEARLIFYYAGHGIPDESQRTSYLLPVDGYGNDATSGYSLESLYAELASIPAKSTLVFMDACFSGAQRDGSMMVEARGVAIKPKEEIPTGKLVVFSAAQGDETAFPYTEKKHGMFTYFLLKKLQDTKGDTTLGELMDYVTTEVKQQSVLQNRKSQTPKVTASQSVADTWKNMKLK